MPDVMPRRRVDVRRSSYLPVLDGLRAIAALAVLFFHATVVAAVPIAAGGAGLWFSSGWLGVDLFFVLSGFLLAHLRLHQASRDWGGERAYLISRCARIFPAFWAQLLVLWGLGMVGIGAPLALSGGFPDLVVQGALLFQLWPWVPAALGHWWSLPVEFGFYLLLPVLAPTLRVGWRMVLLWLLTLGIAVVWRAATDTFTDDPARLIAWAEHLPGRLVQFVTGMALAVAIQRWGSVIPVSAAVIALLIGLPGLFLLPWIFDPVFPRSLAPRPDAVYLLWPAISALSAALAIGGATIGARQVAVAWLSWPALRALGRISFGLYLWHLPIQLAFRAWWGLPAMQERYWLFVLMSTSLSLLAATLSWHLIERPVLAWTHRRRHCQDDSQTAEGVPQRRAGSARPPRGSGGRRRSGGSRPFRR